MRYLPILFPLAVMACCKPPSEGQASAPKQGITAAEYGAKLEDCTRNSKTCDESIDCENKLRADAGRPLRAHDGCK